MLTLLAHSLVNTLRSAAVGALVFAVILFSWASASPEPPKVPPAHQAP